MSQIQETGFSLVSTLAEELSRGDIDLPSLPEAVIQVRNTLSRPDFSVDELARVLTTEPTLVGSILTMANSVTFRRAGGETSDIRIAISRIGAGMVQTAATTFAMRKLRENEKFKQVENLLNPEWSRAGRTAAACYLIAKMTRKVKPDEALVVGLLHNIGRIYLYSRAPQYPGLFASPAAIQQLLDSWHANVGKAIVESWGLPAETVDVIGQQDEINEDPEASPMFSILTAAISTAALTDEPEPEEKDALLSRRDFRRLSLDVDQIDAIIESREEITNELGLRFR